MTSGRKKRIMIACVTFETVKVTDPIDYYEINKAHIIHYIRDAGDERSTTYRAFYDRVVEIASQRKGIEIVEHNERVSDFSVMLRTVLGIIQQEQASEGDCEIFVNISSGSSEYAAAAAIASMMVPGTIPFSVGTREYTVGNDRIRDLYFVDGMPVGLTKSTFEPRTMPSYAIPLPEEHLVRGLRILRRRNLAKQSVTSGKMIAELKSAGLWYRDTDTGNPDNASKQRQTEAVYYQRDFIGKWVKAGWVERDELKGRYILTPEGVGIIETFYQDRGPIPHRLHTLQT